MNRRGRLCYNPSEQHYGDVVWSAPSRLKKLASVDEHHFHVACEDGRIYPFDVRVEMDNGPIREPLDVFDGGAKTLDIRGHLMAVGGSKPYVVVYDQRHTGRPMATYGSGSLAETHTHVTDVRFSDDGNELLVSVGNDNVYLFDVNQRRHFWVINFFV